MIGNKPFLTALCAALSLSAGAALAQDKNPLMLPKQPTAKPAEVAHAPGVPSPDMKLPPAVSASAQPLGGSSLANVGQHLGGLNVVGIIGAKAILRGSIGKSTNFALGSSGDGGDAPKQGSSGQAPGAAAPAGGGDEAGKGGPAVTVVVTHAQPLQLGDGIWVRPDVTGTTVRLFQQPSKDKANAGEVLVYAASLETLSPTAPLAADKGDDKKQEEKK